MLFDPPLGVAVKHYNETRNFCRISRIPSSYLGSSKFFFRICKTTKYKPAGNTFIFYLNISISTCGTDVYRD